MSWDAQRHHYVELVTGRPPVAGPAEVARGQGDAPADDLTPIATDGATR